jgi:protein required for attachment to host cells
MSRPAPPTWFLVADGASAQVYRVTYQPLHLEPVENGRFHDHKAMNRDLESDRPGVSFESVGGARHAIERHSDAHRRREDHFVGKVADFINAAAAGEKFEQLLMVAPPRALAAFRSDLTAKVQELITHEFNGDWTKLGKKDLVDHLVRHLQPF